MYFRPLGKFKGKRGVREFNCLFLFVCFLTKICVNKKLTKQHRPISTYQKRHLFLPLPFSILKPTNKRIEQKGMTFDHDFCYSLPLFYSLLKKEGRRKKEWIAKIMIRCHAFLLNQIKEILQQSFNPLYKDFTIVVECPSTLTWLAEILEFRKG